jgi:S1-C subfamily serine protease
MDVYQPSTLATQPPPARVARYRLPVLLLILAVLVAVAFFPYYLEQVKYRQTRAEVAAINEALPELKIGSMGKLFTLLARKVSPSVVHIKTDRRIVSEEVAAIWGPQIRQQLGEASGVIVDEEGYIVTNHHVLGDADEIHVQLPDGRTRDAERIGSDPKNDLAVIKIEAEGLIPAPWGNSDKLEVGEMVWALGNPFGLDNSLTFGIVSAKDRRVRNTESPYQEYLQTDAAVNPGNSGGPLVNMIGEIIGINTAIIGPTYQGISFAIPSNLAKQVYQQIRESGDVANGYLGVVPAPLTEELAQQLRIKQRPGAVVIGVLRGSPAEKAGLEPRDLIIEWNGEAIDDPQELIHYVMRTAPGTKGKLKLLRDGEEIDLEVTVGRQPTRR